MRGERGEGWERWKRCDGWEGSDGISVRRVRSERREVSMEKGVRGDRGNRIEGREGREGYGPDVFSPTYPAIVMPRPWLSFTSSTSKNFTSDSSSCDRQTPRHADIHSYAPATVIYTHTPPPWWQTDTWPRWHTDTPPWWQTDTWPRWHTDTQPAAMTHSHGDTRPRWQTHSTAVTNNHGDTRPSDQLLWYLRRPHVAKSKGPS